MTQPLLKRKAPISTKKCNSCVKTFKVPASKKFCKYCEDELEVVKKEKPQSTGLGPVCDKHCKQCGAWYVKAPCALKRCKCQSILTKINWNVVANVSRLYIEDVD